MQGDALGTLPDGGWAAQGRCGWGGMKGHLQLCPACPHPGATVEIRAPEDIGLAACLSSGCPGMGNTSPTGRT